MFSYAYMNTCMHTVSSTIQVQQSDLSKQEMEATVIWGVGGGEVWDGEDGGGARARYARTR